MIIINELILQKAVKILKERKEEEEKQRKLQQYITNCLEARICPICGEPLLERQPSKEEEVKSSYDVISYVLYCEKSDFIHIEGWYYDCDDEY